MPPRIISYADDSITAIASIDVCGLVYVLAVQVDVTITLFRPHSAYIFLKVATPLVTLAIGRSTLQCEMGPAFLI